MGMTIIKSFTFTVSVLTAMIVQAQEGIFDEYREMMGDDNPAVFVIDEGEEYWFAPAGPKQATLAECDLGLGPGVLEGAYAYLPRYFEDAGRVMDLEARLEFCMVELQGRSREDIHAKPYSLRGDQGTEMEALAAFIVDQSSAVAVSPSQDRPEERAMYALGEELFYYRAGPHDFSCATCHEQAGMRIRLQDLANLDSHEGAADAYTSWPAYRISEGVVRTMGWRMRDCLRQQRLPELVMGSPASVALQTYLAVNAAGAELAAPGLKR